MYISKIKSINIMKAIYLKSVIIGFLTLPLLSYSQKLVSAIDLGIYPKVIITATGLTNAEYNVKMYKVTYNTTSLTGNSVVASGMICVPVNATCDSLPIALYAHGTVLKRDNVPSADNQEAVIGKAIASRGYVTAMPDYLGLGDLPGLHPYQHAESEAIASVDIMLAAKELIQDSLSITYSNEVFITGYSQGGHAAMATTKYIQDHNLQNDLNVVGSAPLSGAYHASKRQTDELLLDIPYNSPGYIIYLILSYQEVYGNIYNSVSDVVQSPYDTTVVPLFDGSVEASVVHAMLPNRTSQYLTASFINSMIADSAAKTNAMWQALLANDNHDWTPSTAMKLFYCSGDGTVKPQNTEDAYTAMIANGATQVFKEDLGSSLNHGTCLVPAISSAITYFQGIRTDCKAPNSIDERNGLLVGINTYPNPVQNQLNIVLEKHVNATIEIYAMNGSLIYSSTITSKKTINTSQWKSGAYVIRLYNENGQSLKTVSVTR